MTPANDGLYPACVIIVTSANSVVPYTQLLMKEIIVISLRLGIQVDTFSSFIQSKDQKPHHTSLCRTSLTLRDPFPRDRLQRCRRSLRLALFFVKHNRWWRNFASRTLRCCDTPKGKERKGDDFPPANKCISTPLAPV
jgi:hypothetical protein